MSLVAYNKTVNTYINKIRTCNVAKLSISMYYKWKIEVYHKNSYTCEFIHAELKGIYISYFYLNQKWTILSTII